MMRKPLLAAILCAPILAAAPAWAQTHTDASGTIIQGTSPIYGYHSAGAHQSISASTLASATSLTVPTGATIAYICVEAAPVRYWDDGSTPTASSGMPVAASATATICYWYAGVALLANVKFILASGSPTMDVSYYAPN
jgi:hypothetical protein